MFVNHFHCTSVDNLGDFFTAKPLIYYLALKLPQLRVFAAKHTYIFLPIVSITTRTNCAYFNWLIRIYWNKISRF